MRAIRNHHLSGDLAAFGDKEIAARIDRSVARHAAFGDKEIAAEIEHGIARHAIHDIKNAIFDCNGSPFPSVNECQTAMDCGNVRLTATIDQCLCAIFNLNTACHAAVGNKEIPAHIEHGIARHPAGGNVHLAFCIDRSVTRLSSIENIEFAAGINRALADNTARGDNKITAFIDRGIVRHASILDICRTVVDRGIAGLASGVDAEITVLIDRGIACCAARGDIKVPVLLDRGIVRHAAGPNIEISVFTRGIGCHAAVHHIHRMGIVDFFSVHRGGALKQFAVLPIIDAGILGGECCISAVGHINIPFTRRPDNIGRRAAGIDTQISAVGNVIGHCAGGDNEITVGKDRGLADHAAGGDKE